LEFGSLLPLSFSESLLPTSQSASLAHARLTQAASLASFNLSRFTAVRHGLKRRHFGGAFHLITQMPIGHRQPVMNISTLRIKLNRPLEFPECLFVPSTLGWANAEICEHLQVRTASRKIAALASTSRRSFWYEQEW
jgi:hypothetical protein